MPFLVFHLLMLLNGCKYLNSGGLLTNTSVHVRKDKIRLNLKIHDQRWQVETKVAQNTTLWRRTPADCLIILWHMAKSDAVISFSLTF